MIRAVLAFYSQLSIFLVGKSVGREKKKRENIPSQRLSSYFVRLPEPRARLESLADLKETGEGRNRSPIC